MRVVSFILYCGLGDGYRWKHKYSPWPTHLHDAFRSPEGANPTTRLICLKCRRRRSCYSNTCTQQTRPEVVGLLASVPSRIQTKKCRWFNGPLQFPVDLNHLPLFLHNITKLILLVPVLVSCSTSCYLYNKLSLLTRPVCAGD